MTNETGGHRGEHERNSMPTGYLLKLVECVSPFFFNSGDYGIPRAKLVRHEEINEQKVSRGKSPLRPKLWY